MNVYKYIYLYYVYIFIYIDMNIYIGSLTTELISTFFYFIKSLFH